MNGGVTNGVAKVKCIKILRNFQTKKFQNTVVHIKLCGTPKHTDLRLVSSLLLISQNVMIGYVNLRANMKVCEV